MYSTQNTLTPNGVLIDEENKLFHHQLLNESQQNQLHILQQAKEQTVYLLILIIISISF